MHEEVIQNVIEGAKTLGYEYINHTVSPIKGKRRQHRVFGDTLARIIKPVSSRGNSSSSRSSSSSGIDTIMRRLINKYVIIHCLFMFVFC